MNHDMITLLTFGISMSSSIIISIIIRVPMCGRLVVTDGEAELEERLDAEFGFRARGVCKGGQSRARSRENVEDTVCRGADGVKRGGERAKREATDKGSR